MKNLICFATLALAMAGCSKNQPPAETANDAASVASRRAAANASLGADAPWGSPGTELNEQSPTPPTGIYGSPNTNVAPPAPSSEGDSAWLNESATMQSADQGSSEADLKMTAKIRQAVMDDASLSFTAKNVQITTKNGKVLLKGKVNSDYERTSIVSAASKVAGDQMVVDQLQVQR